MQRYEFLAQHARKQEPERNISIVDAIDDSNGKYASALKSRRTSNSELSRKLDAGSDYVKSRIEEKIKEKKNAVKDDVPVVFVVEQFEDCKEIVDVEMKVDDFFASRRQSLEFKQLVWNALSAEWMMDLDQNVQEDDVYVDNDVIMDGTASLICCVLDTNVLIHDLSKFMNFLPQLSDQIKIGGFGGYFFELVIPHVVLQELDALKMAKNNQELSRKAQSAITWLYNALKGNRVGMTFQKKSEVAAFRSSLKKEDFFNMTNDDMVLECAEMLSDPSSSIIASSISNPMARHVFLITNDRGLAVKAMVAQIPSITSKDFPESPQDFLEGLYEVE